LAQESRAVLAIRAYNAPNSVVLDPHRAQVSDLAMFTAYKLAIVQPYINRWWESIFRRSRVHSFFNKHFNFRVCVFNADQELQ
jgi:hypothetical protein